MLYRSKSEAEAVAAALTAEDKDEDGWTYEAVAQHGGYAVFVRDETGALMGAL